MQRLWLVCTLGIVAVAFAASAQERLYKVLEIAKVGGAGRFDYVYADEAERKLYVPRLGDSGRITVFSLDTLEEVGEVPNTSAHGVAISAKSNHGFATSKPVAMWNAKTLTLIKTIDVGGAPDGILCDPFDDRVYIFSHTPPNATVINASDGSIAGTIDLGGAPEQASTDGQGTIYVDVEDKDTIAVIDARTMKVRAHYDLAGRGHTCAGLAMDTKNQILFASCRKPNTMVVLNAKDGKVITTLPIGQGNDGDAFNPSTMEVFSSQSDGTLTVIKEDSPTSFVVEQTVQTMRSAKTLTLDARTGRIFLIAAEYGPPIDTPQQGANARHGPMVPGSFSILVVGK